MILMFFSLIKNKFRLALLKQYMLNLVNHQKFLRVMEIQLMDLYDVKKVSQYFHLPFNNQVDLGHDNESSGLFKRIKSLSIFI